MTDKVDNRGIFIVNSICVYTIDNTYHNVLYDTFSEVGVNGCLGTIKETFTQKPYGNT